MRLFAFAIAVLALAQTGCSSMNNTEKGVGLGGLLGAGVGTAIGVATGNPRAGAVIGGLTGAGVGGLVGNEADRTERKEKDKEIAAAGYAYDQAQPARIEEIVTMAKNGQSDRVIINHIQQNRMHFALGASDLNYLKQNAVPDTVIVEMQNAGERVAVRQPRPVIVREQIIVRDPYYGPPPGVVLVGPYGHCGHHGYRRW